MRHEGAGASEIAGSLESRPPEPPPTQRPPVPSPLQQSAPSRLSTIAGAGDQTSCHPPLSLSSSCPQNPLSLAYPNAAGDRLLGREPGYWQRNLQAYYCPNLIRKRILILGLYHSLTTAKLKRQATNRSHVVRACL